MPLRRVQIYEFSFEISDPFQPGHPLTEVEASALNSLRAENIRNIIRRRIVRLRELQRPLVAAELQAFASQADQAYIFGQVKVAEQADSISRTAREIARALVISRATADGREIDADRLDEETAAVMLEPAVLEEARARWREAQRVATASLEELLGRPVAAQ